MMAVLRRHAMTLKQVEKVSPYQSNTVGETFFPVRADPTRVGAQVQSGPRNDGANPFALIDHEESENSEGSIAVATPNI